MAMAGSGPLAITKGRAGRGRAEPADARWVVFSPPQFLLDHIEVADPNAIPTPMQCTPYPSAIPTRYPRRTPPTPRMPPTHGLRTTPHLYQRPARFIECNASKRELRAVHRQRPFLWTLRWGATNPAARARSSRPVRPFSLSRRSVGPPTGRGRAWLRSTRCAGCVLGYSASDRHGAERVC